MPKKVAIIGAGNVGGTAAMRIAESGIANVVLIDIAENLARAKACDLEDARYSLGLDCRIEGTSDFGRLDNADVVVITAGFARKPGMTREDLFTKNAAVVKEVCGNIINFAKSAIVVVVTNPLDAMTYWAFKSLGFPKNRVFGMGASLDSARFASLISIKLFVSTQQIRALVIGSHGETMIPLPRLTTVRGKELAKILPESDISALVQETKQRGAQIVSLYGTGSAYYGPSAAIYEIVHALVAGQAKDIPVSAILDGEYGLRDVAIGVFARIGSRGVEKIIELQLSTEENAALHQSAEMIKTSFIDGL